MPFVRVATCPVEPGSIDEVVRRANETRVPLYREQSGFEALSIVDAGDYLISISHWHSDLQARAGAEAVIAWVKGQGDLLTGPPTISHFGTEVISVEAS